MSRSHFPRLSILLVACLLMPTVAKALGDPDRIFLSYDASNGLADNSAQSIKVTKTGRMVISTIGHINFYDGDAFVHIDPGNDHVFPLPKYNGHYHLYFDRHHHLWVKDKRQVTCVDLTVESFIKNVGAVIKEMGMTKPVDDMFGDINNNMWFLSGNTLYGTDDKKEFKLRHAAELQDVDVYNKKLHLQFYANGVVSVYDMEKNRFLCDIPALTSDDPLRYSDSSVILPDSNLYYQIRNGNKESVLMRLDIEKRQWTTLMRLPYHLNNMVMRDGMLYVASEYGYWVYDVETGDSQHIETVKLSRNRTLQTDINTIAFDRQGGMWLGTERRGILYSRPFRSPFTNYSWNQPEALVYEALLNKNVTEQALLPRHVNCQYRDSRGWLWTGLYTGLQLNRPDQQSYTMITEKDGLRNEMIHSIIEDDNHDIWVGTSFGISHLQIVNGKVGHIETYIQSDNVPNESFVNGRVMKQPDGTIIMQSLDHIVVFNPKNLIQDSLKSFRLAPKLVRVQVNGHQIEPGMELEGKVIIDRAVSRLWEINVDYDQNTLSLVFSGLNFARPIQTYYRVRVQGLFNDWRVYSYTNSRGMVDPKGLLHMQLSALKPGKYVVEVQVSMDPDHFEMRPYHWNINVDEPWWRSTGIYLLLGLILLLLGIANVVLFNKNTRMAMLRNSKENDILRRISNYVKRCDELHEEVLSLANTTDNTEVGDEENKEFIDAMLLIVPYLHTHSANQVSMRKLAELTGLEVSRLFELLSTNFYQNPRQMVAKLRIQEAAELLRTTKKSVEQIADELKFISPNYFIAVFYHQYRQTPLDYRKSRAL
ncbi:MAG: helix-turn-helix domain-containing protein [Prevotella sp.]|nr:helix-turn-helix domain-containing protein [Prevotella sp.]